MSEEMVVAILAAGASRRLGRPKQLEVVGGEMLIRRVTRAAVEAGVGRVVVVCGCRGEEVGAAVSGLGAEVVMNEEWEEGMGSSIRVAGRVAEERGARGLMVVLGDQKGLGAEGLRRAAIAWREAGEEKACRSREGAYAGPPVVFPAWCFEELRGVRGDEGAKAVLARLGDVIEVDVEGAGGDLDVEGDVGGDNACQEEQEKGRAMTDSIAQAELELRSLLQALKDDSLYSKLPESLQSDMVQQLQNPDPEFSMAAHRLIGRSNASLGDEEVADLWQLWGFLPEHVLQYYYPRLFIHTLDNPESPVMCMLSVHLLPPVKAKKYNDFLNDKVAYFSAMMAELVRRWLYVVAHSADRFGENSSRNAQRALKRHWGGA